MSIIITLTGMRPLATRFDKILDQWLRENKQLLGDHGKCYIPENDHNSFNVFGNGCHRGVILQRNTKGLFGEVTCKLNILASRVDWRLFLTLINHLSNRWDIRIGGEKDWLPQSKKLTDEIVEEQWRFYIESSFNSLHFMLEHMHNTQIVASVPGGFSIVIPADTFYQLESKPDPVYEIDSYISRQVERLSRSNKAMVHIGSESQSSYSIWLLDERLFTSTVDYICIPAKNYTAPEDKYIIIPWVDFLSILGDKAEYYNFTHNIQCYVPAFDLNRPEDLRIYEKLLQYGDIDDPPERRW